MILQRLSILIVCIFTVSRITAQEFVESNFEHYSMSDGMSHNSAAAVTQDPAGYIWITTPSGLNRYDGSHFVQFHSSSDTLSLLSEELAGMFWLDNYRLAVATAGLYIIDTRTGKTHNLVIPYEDKKYQYKFNVVMGARGDKEGNVFVLSRSGFYQFDKNYQLVYRFDFYKKEDVPLEHFFFGRDLLEMDEYRMMAVAIDGLYIYDKRKKQFKRMASEDCPLLAEFLDYGEGVRAYSFFQQKPGHWFVLKSGSDSIVYVNISGNKKVVSKSPINPISNEIRWRSRMSALNDTTFFITSHYSGFFKMHFDPLSGAVAFYPERHFKSQLCNGLAIDKDKNMWIATNNGLFRQDPGKSQVLMTKVPSRITDSIPDIRIDDISIAAGKLFAGTRGRGGLLVFNEKSLRFEKQVMLKDVLGEGGIIDAVITIDSNSVLLGTEFPVLYNPASGREKILVTANWEGWINDMCKDSKGNIWISAMNIYRYNPNTQEFKLIPTHQRLLSIPFAIEEDRDGNIWTAGHGLARYNTTLDSFDLLLDSFPHLKMLDKQVNALTIDDQNTVWFNSNNNGLTGYDIRTNSFRHFTRKDGLPDDNIGSMIAIDNKLWMASYSGIACMDLNSLQIVSFGKEDGFPEMPVMKNARFYYDKQQQQLYIGFSQAVVKFNPYDLLRRKSPPDVFIESVSINEQKDFLPGPQIATSWKNNDILITIGSINFSDGSNQAFAYRILKNEQTPWQQLGSQSSFSISNLAPGTYRIQVKVLSLNNRWPAQVKEISIVVSPPFWRKEWFIVSMSALTLILLYLFVQWRTGVATKKEMENTHIQKLKADHYKNQFELEQISNYFSSSLAGKNTEEEVLWDVARNLIGRMNYVDCMIYLWNEDKTKMVQKAAFGPKGKPEYISANVFDVLPGQGVVGHVIETRQPVLIKDTRLDSRYRVDEEFRLSEICVPIIHNDELMGIIDSEHYAPDYFTERDIKILTTIGTLIGNKLKQIESEKHLEVKQQELANINEQLAEARLSALQAQMNPHFVFNALNSIKRMILDGDNETASRYLSKFALMIRMTLNHSKEIFVTLEENIEYLKAYLEMEQLRFDDSFTYSIFTEENIDTAETAIPSMMMQPLVENAIWHGLMQAENDKRIQIGFTQRENKITCTIEDNGIGIRESERLKKVNHSTHHSVGLENLKKRIKIMNEKYDMNCSLVITDLQENGKNGHGTKAVLRFNVINI